LSSAGDSVPLRRAVSSLSLSAVSSKSVPLVVEQASMTNRMNKSANKTHTRFMIPM
jgi:hypothetical protein